MKRGTALSFIALLTIACGSSAMAEEPPIVCAAIRQDDRHRTNYPGETTLPPPWLREWFQGFAVYDVDLDDVRGQEMAKLADDLGGRRT